MNSEPKLSTWLTAESCSACHAKLLIFEYGSRSLQNAMPCYAMLCHAMSCSLPPGSAPVTIDCDAFDTSLVSLLSLLHAGPLQPEFHPESSKTTDLQHGACCSCKRCQQAVESNCIRVLPQQDAPPERHLGPAALGTHHLKFTSLCTETWNVHAPQ